MRTPVALKSLEDCRESLDVEVELDLDLDLERRVVALHMLEFEADLVASFVAQSLPYDHGVRVADSPFEHVQALPRFDLVIALAGRQRQPNGSTRRTLVGRIASHVADGAASMLLSGLAAPPSSAAWRWAPARHDQVDDIFMRLSERVARAEADSARVCERCGAPGVLERSGWWNVRCAACNGAR